MPWGIHASIIAIIVIAIIIASVVVAVGGIRGLNGLVLAARQKERTGEQQEHEKQREA